MACHVLALLACTLVTFVPHIAARQLYQRQREVPAEVADAMCMGSKWHHTARAMINTSIATKRWEHLENHPCFDPDTLASIRQDPRDADEFFMKESESDELSDELSMCEKLPEMLYLGYGHSGSTSLAMKLAWNKHMSFGTVKEHSFFKTFKNVDPHLAFNLYKKEFRVPCSVKVTFDAMPSLIQLANTKKMYGGASWLGHYEFGYPAVKAVKAIMGSSMKFVALFRDPLLFLTSRAQELGKDVSEVVRSKGLSGAMGNEWKKTCYADEVKIWLDVFPRTQFRFYDADDFFSHPRETLDSVTAFVGVPAKLYSHSELSSSQGRRRANHNMLTDDLRNFFHRLPRNVDCKKRLESLTGLVFKW